MKHKTRESWNLFPNNKKMAGQTSVSALFDNVFQNVAPPPPQISAPAPVYAATPAAPSNAPAKKNLFKPILLLLAVVGVLSVMFLFFKMKKKTTLQKQQRKGTSDDDEDEDEKDNDDDEEEAPRKTRKARQVRFDVPAAPPLQPNHPPQHQFPPQQFVLQPPTAPQPAPGFTETGGLPDSMLAPMPPPDYNPGSGVGTHLPPPPVPASAPLQPQAPAPQPQTVLPPPTLPPPPPASSPKADPNFIPL